MKATVRIVGELAGAAVARKRTMAASRKVAVERATDNNPLLNQKINGSSLQERSGGLSSK